MPTSARNWRAEHCVATHADFKRSATTGRENGTHRGSSRSRERILRRRGNGSRPGMRDYSGRNPTADRPQLREPASVTRTMSPIDRIAADIRNAVNAATDGDVDRFVSLDEIEKQLALGDNVLCQAAAHRAADEGWLRTNGGREVHSVAVTVEGRRLAQVSGPRRRKRGPAQGPSSAW